MLITFLTPVAANLARDDTLDVLKTKILSSLGDAEQLLPKGKSKCKHLMSLFTF